jgi:hypothetical protein
MHEMFERMDRQQERIDRERERNDGEHARIERVFNERFDRVLRIAEVIAEATRNREHRISDLEQRQ